MDEKLGTSNSSLLGKGSSKMDAQHGKLGNEVSSHPKYSSAVHMEDNSGLLKFVKIRKKDLKKLSGWDLMVYATLNSFFFPDRESIYTTEDLLLEFMNVSTSKNKARDRKRIRNSLEILQSLEYITFYQKESLLICNFHTIDEEFITLQTNAVEKIVNTPLEIREKQNLLKVYISIYSRFSLNDYAYPGISTIAQDVGLSNSTTFKMIELLQKFGLMHVHNFGLYKTKKSNKILQSNNFYTTNFTASSEQMRRYAEADIRDFGHWINL